MSIKFFNFGKLYLHLLYTYMYHFKTKEGSIENQPRLKIILTHDVCPNCLVRNIENSRLNY